MQQILQRIGLLTVMLLAAITSFAYSFEAGGIYYNILTDNVSVEVTYRNTDYDSYTGEIVIPSEVTYKDKTFTVSQIGERAFYKCSTVTSLSIPPSIKKFNFQAFNVANHIKKVNISNLSAWCMIDAQSNPLEEGVTLYLNNSPITSLESLDSTCTTIGRWAFYAQTTLTKAILPESITSVQDGAFVKCTNLSYLEVGSNVTSMGDGAFASCSSLKTIKFCDSDKWLKLGRYQYNTSYTYFKDCPLNEVYIGRNINWERVSSISDDPFTTVQRAVFNRIEAYDNGFSDNLTTVYVGPKCHRIGIDSKKLSNLYIFTNDLTFASLGSYNSDIFLIDKNNVPECFSELSYQSIRNLVDVKNLQTGASYVYGNFPQFDLNNFENNVTGMTFNIPQESMDYSVGYHNQGLPGTFLNDLWSVTINYPFTYTITPAELTVIANDASRTYGTENPELTCSYFGFKNGETYDVLTQLPKVETTATVSSNAGTYPIIPSGAEAMNYTFKYERGTLTITKSDQTIEWDQEFDDINVGDILELTATSSSGLPVKYTSSDENIAEVYTQSGKKYVEFLKEGTVYIRATQEGNENYNEADRVRKTIVVSEPEIQVSSIILNPSSVEGKEGEQIQINATILPEDATNKVLSWSSSDEKVATVNDSGLISLLKKGTAVVTASATDESGMAAECAVVVSESSGIESILNDRNTYVRIFNFEGVLVYEGKYSEADLAPDYYIMVCGGKSVKVMVP